MASVSRPTIATSSTFSKTSSSCSPALPRDAASAQPLEVQQAVHLARVLCQRARELQTPQERRQQAELDRMIHSPHDKATLMQLTDQAFRSRRPHRAADQLIHILDVQGVPRFFSALDRTLLLGFQSFGSYLPGVAMPLVKERMQQETANVILPAERELLAEHLRARWEEGVRMNVNFLGEALLGEEDAQRRLQGYLAALQQPEIEVISVKISTIYSQISALAREHTVDVLCDRLELLFRAAAKASFTRRDGTIVPKFVYLDMEEYRDKELTAEVFMRTLDRPGLEQARAGIALQAYIPDSFATQQRINEWARKRVAAGGAPVTIRLVKGANMEAERVEASLRGWPQAPYKTKLETDANYLRMLHEGMRPENLAAVRLGIASHNLFTLAYGLVLADAGRRARSRAVRDARRHGQPPAAGAVRADAATCCSTPRPAGRRISPTPSATSSAGSTRTPGRTISCATRSTSKSTAPSGSSSSSSSSTAFEAMESVSAAHRAGRRIGVKSRESRVRSRIDPGPRLSTLDSSTIPQRTRHRLVAAAERRVGEVDHRVVGDQHGAIRPPTCRS